MNRRGRLFFFGILVGLVIATVLNLLPFWWTYEAYNYDGFEVMGFPFTFSRVGGIASIYEFHTALLLWDIAIALAFAVAMGWAAMQLSRLIHPTGRGFPILPPSRDPPADR